MRKFLPKRSWIFDCTVGVSQWEKVGNMATSSFWLLGGSQSALTCRLIRSQTFRQQLGKYAVKLLPGRTWEMGVFAVPSVLSLGI